MNKREKSENRKALPKFFGIVLLGAFVGGIVGGVTGFFGGTMVPDHIVESIYSVLATTEPYGIWIVTVLFTVLEIRLYLQAKSIYQKWDAEDENTIEIAEEKLSWILLFTSINLVINFFLVGAAKIIIADQVMPYLLLLTGFVVSLIVIAIMQQKVVDLTKKINPEKKGSVYDIEFQRKWMESCDENEQRQIGQAAFKAYTAVINICIVLWLILFFISDMFELGVMPIFVVTVIWGISQIVYCCESIRLSKHN